MHTWKLVALLAGATALATAQTAPQSQPNTAGQSSTMAKPQADTAAAQKKGPVIPVTLNKSIDSKKAKAGDTIEAKTTVSLNSAKGQVPAGSKVMGHITDAKAKGKGDAESSLSFAFDKIEVKKGEEIPFHAIAQAIAARPNENGPMSAQYPDQQGAPSGAASANASSPAGHPGTAGTTAAPPPSASGNMGDSSAPAQNAGSQLTQDSTGVVGIKGLSLQSQAGSSIVSSDSKSVKLDGGTQILLRVLQQ